MLTPQAPVMPYDVLTPGQAADYLQVDEETVIREAEAGRLPGQKIGGQWRFLRLAITEWLRSEKPEPIKPSLADWFQRHPRQWTAEEERLAEAEIAQLYSIRKSWSSLRGENG